MPLPVRPPPRSEDVAIHGWSGLTTRIAWTLLKSGVQCTRPLVEACREHVLYHLDPFTQLPDAEDRAEHLTRQFVARARNRTLDDPWPGDAEMPLSPTWVRALRASTNSVDRAVLRLHYGDGKSKAHVAERLHVERSAIDASCAGLQEVLKDAAAAEGVPLGAWTRPRLDRLIERLANWTPDECPPMYDIVAGGSHEQHRQACQRCKRMWTLVKRDLLDTEDLQPPSLRARPARKLALYVVQIHPDARAHRPLLLEALDDARPLGDDLLLVRGDDPDAFGAVLRMAARLGKPARHQLRAARFDGPGAWTTYGPIGRGVEQGCVELRSRPWGTVDGFDALPEALPPAPSASWAWALAGVAALAAVAAVGVAIAPGEPAEIATEARIVPDDGGTWVAFDTPEDHHVALLSDVGGAPTALLTGAALDEKAALAVGDGSYRAFTPGRRVLLISSPSPVPLDTLLTAANGAPDPIGALQLAALQLEPRPAVIVGGR